ncbi:MAG: hypothetical protein FIA95_07165 [Gemmatimonadetes bacterium]|nr:hypothetical protein [Gemmatimonadota bacterium]
MALWSCAPGPAADLGTLVLRDSTYLEPGTLEPFSGRVVRHFTDAPEKVELKGTLVDGTWEGELTVYHESGRIRYQGQLSAGAPCGAWVENREDAEAASVYETLLQDVESLGVYPDCPERRGFLSSILRR